MTIAFLVTMVICLVVSGYFTWRSRRERSSSKPKLLPAAPTQLLLPAAEDEACLSLGPYRTPGKPNAEVIKIVIEPPPIVCRVYKTRHNWIEMRDDRLTELGYRQCAGCSCGCYGCGAIGMLPYPGAPDASAVQLMCSEQGCKYHVYQVLLGADGKIVYQCQRHTVCIPTALPDHIERAPHKLLAE